MICPACSSEIPAGFKFCGNCGHKLAAAPPAEPPAPAAPTSERREVSVLFADVSGFTRMSERLDPEEVHAVMNECFAGLGAAIRDEEGYIDKYIGDAVMALFGAPVAHEDDPARACRAALAMQAFLVGFAERCQARAGVALRMRIGIHCGLVLAGGVGSDVRMDYSVMGDTVNLASRLESNAPPGGVLVSREVVRRTRGRFGFGPPRQLTVKGKTEPVEAFELLDERTDADVRGRDGLSVGLIGRDAELRELTAQWTAAQRGVERRIEVRGEMGIGKTRLVEEAAHQIGDVRLIGVVATPDAAARRPFGLARRLVLDVLRGLGGDARSVVESREAFGAALAPLGAPLAPFADALWHLAAPTRLAVPAPDPDPQVLRRTVEQGIRRLLVGLAAHAPDLTLLLDSYELADDASAAVLDATWASPAGEPAGVAPPVVATTREERRAPAGAPAPIRLGPLTLDAAGQLLDQLVRGVTLPAGLRRDLLDRAAGVPLFIEEMVRSLVDQGALARDEAGTWRWQAAAEPSALSLPASIRGAMVARLDRLVRPERDFLRRCAVQGMEFLPEIADAVGRAARSAGGEPASPADLLDDLARRGLVRDLGQGRWAFRQPLLQEACYETLTLRERRTLHAETADALCAHFGGPELVAPEPLAYHYERAERWGAAAAAHLRAGDRAAGLFLNDEAVERYRRTLEALARVAAPSEAERRLEALAHGGAARVQLRVGAYAQAEAHARLMRDTATRPADRAEAERLIAAACGTTGRTPEAQRRLLEAVEAARSDAGAPDVLVDVLYDLAELYFRANRTQAALDRLTECRLAAPAGDDRTSVRADMLEGKIAHTEGRFADAASLYARAYEAAERVGSLSDRARAANNLGNAARDLGDYAAARTHFERALEIWERTGDVEGIAGAQNNLGNLAMSQGDFARAQAHHSQSSALFTRIGNVWGAALAGANLAIMAMEQDDGASARGHAEAALGMLTDSGDAHLRGLILVVLGEAHLACGDPGAAEPVFDRVLREYDDTRHPLALAGAWRGRGRIALVGDAPAEALQALDRALETFERLQRAQEAARTTLFRAEALWRLGQPDQARATLEQALSRFAAMHADRDVRRVERLLRQWGRPPGR
jgi:adenylate cyclase